MKKFVVSKKMVYILDEYRMAMRNQVLGIADKIMRRTRAKGRGQWVCTAKDFLDFGSHATVGQALSRLAKTAICGGSDMDSMTFRAGAAS